MLKMVYHHWRSHENSGVQDSERFALNLVVLSYSQGIYNIMAFVSEGLNRKSLCFLYTKIDDFKCTQIKIRIAILLANRSFLLIMVKIHVLCIVRIIYVN